MPISIAWTTPGLALLATIGAVRADFRPRSRRSSWSALLIMLTGLWSPLGRLVAAIPKPIASAMLAGILLKLCLAPFMAIGKVPWLAAAVLVTWLAVACALARGYAVPAAVIVALVGDGVRSRRSPASRWRIWCRASNSSCRCSPSRRWSTSRCRCSSSRWRDRTCPASRCSRPTTIGRASRRCCSRPARRRSRARRSACRRSISRRSRRRCAPGRTRMPTRRAATSPASSAASATWLLAALAGVAAVLVARSPPVLIEAVAGLALIGAFGGAMLNAVQDEDGRLPGLDHVPGHRVGLCAVRHRLGVLGPCASAWSVHQLCCAPESGSMTEARRCRNRS